jgi:DNA-binding response OmpR family regulator
MTETISAPTPFRILLVEDDLSLQRGLVYTLRKEGFSVETAATLATAARALNALSPERGTVAVAPGFDLAILDVGLPDGSGFDLCRDIRRVSDLPVIFLTACDEEVHVVMGLDIGGDDYIAKPFRVNELLSRINAVLRRRAPRGRSAERPLRAGPFELVVSMQRVFRDGEPLQLTGTEFKLMLILVRAGGAVVTREKLIELLWDSEEHFVDSNTLSVYVRRLREKIGEEAVSGGFIETVRGIGYRWR